MVSAVTRSWSSIWRIKWVLSSEVTDMVAMSRPVVSRPVVIRARRLRSGWAIQERRNVVNGCQRPFLIGRCWRLLVVRARREVFFAVLRRRAGRAPEGPVRAVRLAVRTAHSPLGSRSM